MGTLNPILLLIGCLFFLNSNIQGQSDSLPLGDQSVLSDMIEDYVQGLDSEDFDFNTLFEDLENFRRHPLNLNKAGKTELSELKLLNQLQINNLIRYREFAGPLLSIYELQAVPGFDLTTIRVILPFIKVDEKGLLSATPILKMMSQGTNELYLRTGRIVEKKRGYIPSSSTGIPAYIGDRFDHFVRFRHSFENRLSYGFTAQKDPGEAFFTDNNRYGFDFYSFHFFLRQPNKYIKSLALGDFRVSFGQGLLIHSGFGTRKSAFVMNIKRSGEALRQYTSLDENNFMRGAGITLQLNRHLEITAFASHKRRDATINIDTLDDVDDELVAFSSLLNTGLHRTQREIDNKHTLQHTTLGSRIKYERTQWHLAANVLYDHFDKPFQRNTQVYNQFYFAGSNLLGLSTDYTYIYRNFHFFGETAMSHNGSIASINGLFASLDRTVDVALLHRNLPRDYHSIFPNVFAENLLANNEQGLYAGIEIKPDKHWKWSAYADLWRHPWLRYQVNAPSQGSEYFTRISYNVKRKADFYIQFRIKTRERNDNSDAQIKTRPLIPHSRIQWRLQMNHKVNKTFDLRSRIELSAYKIGNQSTTRGFMIYQDLLYKPIGFPLSIVSRIAFFDTEDFNSRIYAYENDVVYSFSVPVFYNQGARYYINLRYRGIRNLSIEFRLAQTWYTNIENIGTGQETIPGNRRTDWKVQVKYQF
jgi:hypothetical protein